MIRRKAHTYHLRIRQAPFRDKAPSQVTRELYSACKDSNKHGHWETKPPASRRQKSRGMNPVLGDPNSMQAKIEETSEAIRVTHS